jgi:integrase
MSVSDSVSDSSPKTAKSRSRSAYGDGAIWSVKKPSGTIVWKVEISLGMGDDGKLRKTRRTVATKAEAIELRRVLNAKKLQGELQKKVSVRFEAFSIHWVREVKTQRVRATTAADYEYRVRRYLVPYFIGQNIDELRPVDIQRWTSKLRSQGLSTNTVNGARRILFGIFRYAVRQGVVLSNPVEATDALKRQPEEASQVQPHWSRKEATQALTAARKTPELDLFLHLAVFLGLRHGELLGLTWSSIDLENRTLSVTQTLTDLRTVNPDGSGHVRSVANPPKTAASRRTLHLSEQNMAAIERHKMFQSIRRVQAGSGWMETDYVFTTSIGTPVSQANSLKVFKAFVRANELRYIRIHDIRHTTAVLALEAGASLEWISQAFGHTGTEITKSVYAPYVQVLNDKFVDALDGYLGDH